MPAVLHTPPGHRTGSHLRAGGSSVMGSPGFAGIGSVMQCGASSHASTQPARSNVFTHPMKRPGAAARVYMRTAAAGPDQAQAAGANTFARS